MITRLSTALLLASFLGACSDASTSHANHALTLSVTTQTQGALADVTVGAGTSSLVVTKAQLVARRIELAPAGATTCANTAEDGDGSGSGEDGCAQVETGPSLIDLPLDATTKTSISAAVPAGTYRALEMRIGPITSGNRSSVAFLSAHPELAGVSVHIEGTYNGQPFVFSAPVNASVESEFSTPVTVDANNPNVTIAIDIASWFSDGSGGTLDPSNSGNLSRISANIARSFHAFEDDNHDGHDDHQR
jgi:hypothetical protein